MNWAIKIISKTLIAKISYISWGVTTKAFTVCIYHKSLSAFFNHISLDNIARIDTQDLYVRPGKIINKDICEINLLGDYSLKSSMQEIYDYVTVWGAAWGYIYIKIISLFKLLYLCNWYGFDYEIIVE